MKSKEYIELARRTVNCDLTKDDYLIMYTLGLVGESNELNSELSKSGNRDNIVKECGDLYWYLYNFMAWIKGYDKTDDVDSFYLLLDKCYFDTNEFKEQIRDRKSSSGLCSNISRISAVISEIVKKTKFHGHKLDHTNLFLLLDGIDMNLRMLLVNQHISREDALISNIEKLKKRYPDGFKSTDSIERKE